MTNVCVVGVGAIGSLFAAHLAQLDDVTVWAFDVSAAQVDAITDILRLVILIAFPAITLWLPPKMG